MSDHLTDPATHVLLLGGTTEARVLAAELALAFPGWQVTTSLAGRVQRPADLPGQVRIGGFGGAAGLAAWIAENEVTCVIDATHPFAQRITHNAALACSPGTGAAAHPDEAVPLLRLERPAWQAEPGDDWHHVPDVQAAAALVAQLGSRALITIGRQEASAFAQVDTWCLLRSIEAPDGLLPADHELLLDKGPYSVESERALIASRSIDVLVTKNSGGQATAAKLTAAREAGIPVIMVDRPAVPAGVQIATSIPEALLWLASMSATRQVTSGRAGARAAQAGAEALRALGWPMSGPIEDVLAVLESGQPVDVDNAANWPLPPLGPAATAAAPSARARILLTDMAPAVAASFTPDLPTAIISVPSLVVGLATTSQATPEHALAHVCEVLADNLLAEESVVALAGLAQPGMSDGEHDGTQAGEVVPGQTDIAAAVARSLSVPWVAFDEARLAQQPVPHPSEHTQDVAGTPSIAEAAVLAYGAKLVVTKHFTTHGEPGAAAASTVAVGRVAAPAPGASVDQTAAGQVSP